MTSAGDDGVGPTRLAVLIGDPVAHSVSPAIHAAGFCALGIDAVYLACRVVAPELGEAVRGLHALGALGANVTVPHKQRVVPLARTVSPEVEALGAANTLVRLRHGWHAENTDVEGFLWPLRFHADRLAGANAVVLGAGGAARAVVYGLLRELPVCSVSVLARRPEQAEVLVRDLRPHAGRVLLHAGALDLGRDRVRSAGLVVNATTVGMGASDATPWPWADDLQADSIVYDLVYRPQVTRLLREAGGQGAQTIGGLPMLIAQAAASFRLWTGQDLPTEPATAAALHALQS